MMRAAWLASAGKAGMPTNGRRRSWRRPASVSGLLVSACAGARPRLPRWRRRSGNEPSGTARTAGASQMSLESAPSSTITGRRSPWRRCARLTPWHSASTACEAPGPPTPRTCPPWTRRSRRNAARSWPGRSPASRPTGARSPTPGPAWTRPRAPWPWRRNVIGAARTRKRSEGRAGDVDDADGVVKATERFLAGHVKELAAERASGEGAGCRRCCRRSGACPAGVGRRGHRQSSRHDTAGARRGHRHGSGSHRAGRTGARAAPGDERRSASLVRVGQ